MSDPLLLTLSPISQNKTEYLPPTEQNPLQLATTIQPLFPRQIALPFDRQRQSNTIANKILVSTVLALLLLISGGFFYYFGISQPARQHIHTAATASSKIDKQTLLYLTATSGSPALDNSLNHNDSTISWTESTSPEGNSCSFRDEAYYATALQPGLYPCLAQGNDFSNLTDFTYQAQMTIIQGNQGGLIFRSNTIDQNNYPFSTNYYLFSIESDGHYNLSYQGDKSRIILKRDTTTAIQMGLNHPNLLTVIASGSKLALYINKQYIVTVSDTNRNSGMLGVFAQKSDHDTEIAFRNVQLWSLDGKSLLL